MQVSWDVQGHQNSRGHLSEACPAAEVADERHEEHDRGHQCDGVDAGQQLSEGWQQRKVADACNPQQRLASKTAVYSLQCAAQWSLEHSASLNN